MDRGNYGGRGGCAAGAGVGGAGRAGRGRRGRGGGAGRADLSLVPVYVPEITAGPHFGPPAAKPQTCHLCPPFGLKVWQGQRMRCL